MHKEATAISVIVSTYNWPRALQLSLAALARQSRLPDEVIVADDGSGPATLELLHALAADYPTRLVHVWQEHRGFRVARARNRAIAAARGDYVLLLDGDMLAQRDFVADHLYAARRGCFTQGARALARARLTDTILQDGGIDVGPLTPGLDRRKHALRLPPAIAALLRRPRSRGRKAVMSCNQGYWREDLLACNGFDERMVGWGREDTELALRCYHRGVQRLQLHHTALALHLHHAPRGRADADNPNNAFLRETVRLRSTRCEIGVSGHLAEFATPPPDLRLHAPALQPDMQECA